MALWVQSIWQSMHGFLQPFSWIVWDAPPCEFRHFCFRMNLSFNLVFLNFLKSPCKTEERDELNKNKGSAVGLRLEEPWWPTRGAA